MLNIKKAFNLKIVSLALIGFFILNSAVYGADLSAKPCLRVKLLSNTIEGKDRLKEGLKNADSSEKKSIKIEWVNFGIWRSYWFAATGIETVAGYVERHYQGNRVLEQEIFYYNPEEEAEFIEHILTNPPDYLCFSINPMFFDLAVGFARRIHELRKIKDALSNVKFVFGNLGLMGRQEKILSYIPDALVVINEGEEAMLGIIEGKPLSKIPNLYSTDVSGQQVFTFNRMLQAQDYTAPKTDIPTYNKRPAYLYRDVGIVEHARGCSKAERLAPCSYCVHSALKTNMPEVKWRLLNIEETTKSIIDQARLGKKVINFAADDFMGPSPESDIIPLLEKIWELKRTGQIPSDMKFYSSIMVSSVYSAKSSSKENESKIKILKMMRQVGFTTVFIGFESGSRRQLKRYIKGVTPEENLRAIEILKELGFHIDGGFITFDPLMSLDDGLEDVRFLEICGVPKLSLFPFNYMHVFPDTAYEKMLQKKQLDPKAIELMEIIQQVTGRIPFFYFELFLQRLRTFYFLDIEHGKIEEYEAIIEKYRNIALPFLRDMLTALKEDRPTKDIIDRFLRDHQQFLDGFYSWARIEIPEMFTQKDSFPSPERDILLQGDKYNNRHLLLQIETCRKFI